jgi:ABC-type microcin C transport system permease subunit YejB
MEDRGPRTTKEVVERAVRDRRLIEELRLEAGFTVLHADDDFHILHVVMAERPIGAGKPIPHNHSTSSLVTTVRSDHVRTARAKGLRESTVLMRHALRNSMGAALSMGGLQIGLMFAGVVVIESVFAWPGIGLYTVQSIPRNDFPAIAGVTLVLGAADVVINAVVDILQAVADPRIAL